MNISPREALTKGAYDELVDRLGRPPSWPPLGKRKPGHGPDNAVATNRQSTEGTNR